MRKPIGIDMHGKSTEELTPPIVAPPGTLPVPELDVPDAEETEEIISDLLGDGKLERIPYSSTYPETDCP